MGYEMGWIKSITWMKQKALNLIQHAWSKAYEWNHMVKASHISEIDNTTNKLYRSDMMIWMALLKHAM
jgi:high-affinity nickel permease